MPTLDTRCSNFVNPAKLSEELTLLDGREAVVDRPRDPHASLT